MISESQMINHTSSSEIMSRISSIDGIPLNQEPGLGALTLSGFMLEVCENYSTREALCWRDFSGKVRRWTYAEMRSECERVAKSLLTLGVGRGARVGVLISNRPEWIFSVFGAAMAGAVTVALNTFSTQHELLYQLKQADIQLLIMEAGVASRNFVSDVLELCPALTNVNLGDLLDENLPFLRRVICIDDDKAKPGLQSWTAFLAEGKKAPAAIVNAAAAASSPIDHALIFFSSGSTAQPKAILQTHRAATVQCWRFGNWFELDSSVRTWSANGFFWSGNFAMAFGALSVGGCLVLQRYFLPDESLALLESEKVSHVLAWPHQQARLKECSGWSDADLSSLIYVDSDSVFSSHPSVKTTWRQINGYGLTETFTFVTGVSSSQNTRGSHGVVLPGNTLRIVDPDTGEILPFGETGEIIVKGPTLTPGYLKTAPEAIFDREGFIHTADAGYLTEDGHLFWKGRIGDIIKSGGANISPTEIDEILITHPAIQSVFTVGIPHETMGEIVVSCVVSHEGIEIDEEAVRHFAKQSLASYKVPRYVLFFAEKDLPMTGGSSKIRRAELRVLVNARLREAQDVNS